MSEPNLERQQSVLDLLHQFKGTEPLKRLFWSELNYDRVNTQLSRRGWTETVAGELAEDPLLLASGANDFHVIYSRLNSEKLLMGMERPVVSKLLKDHPYALFLFSNSRQDQFHFLNVKYDDDVQKRRMFRRITVGPNERLRTASERIALLDLAAISPDLFGLSPLAVQQRHDKAFDVELVTREFFSEYHRIFEEVEESITGFGRDKERKHLFTQRLFNRLMFIAFIQKKGWLKFGGDTDYLAALWKAQLRDDTLSDKNFYRDRLKPLFFFGLNGANEIDLMNSNRGAFKKTIIGDVPYLNGGLFEEDDDDKNADIKVPDKAMAAILGQLFNRFNFTVTESTPLDVEVAVDPEMLGKIFEELVTGRHETGSYYTPKPIVSFMCREALKGYLETSTSGESQDAVERFVEKHEPNDLRNEHFKKEPLKAITAKRISEYRIWRAEQKVGPATLNAETGILRRILKRAKLWARVADDIRPLKEPYTIGRALTEEEQQRLLKTAVMRPEWETAYLAAILCLNTTARGCELKGLTWGDIDLFSRTLTIRKSKTAAGERVIPLTDVATSALARLRRRADSFGPVEQGHYVFAAFTPKFTFSGKKVAGYSVTGWDPMRHVGSWRSAWRTLTKKAGLPGFRFHDMRHCAITLLAEGGASDATIMSVAGHVSKRMLERYSHVRMEAKRKAMEALAASTKRAGYDTSHDTNVVMLTSKSV